MSGSRANVSAEDREISRSQVDGGFLCQTFSARSSAVLPAVPLNLADDDNRQTEHEVGIRSTASWTGALIHDRTVNGFVPCCNFSKTKAFELFGRRSEQSRRDPPSCVIPLGERHLRHIIAEFVVCLSKSRNEDRALLFEARNPRVSQPLCARPAPEVVNVDRNSPQHRRVQRMGYAAGCRRHRRRGTTTLRCGLSSGADRRLLEWRQCDRMTAV